MNSPNLVMQVSLNRVESSTSEPQPTMLVSHTAPDAAFPNTRMLEGRLVSSAHLVRDLDGSKACFFVFTDLSIRLEGSFTLLFQLVHLGPVVEYVRLYCPAFSLALRCVDRDETNKPSTVLCCVGDREAGSSPRSRRRRFEYTAYVPYPTVTHAGKLSTDLVLCGVPTHLPTL